eukprot:2967858-Rhodomonas_salina.2
MLSLYRARIRYLSTVPATVPQYGTRIYAIVPANPTSVRYLHALSQYGTRIPFLSTVPAHPSSVPRIT